MYKPKHFRLFEVLPQKIYDVVVKRYKDQYIWDCFRLPMLLTIDAIRSYIEEPIYINNWYHGGQLHNCGFREFNYYKTKKYVLSQHCLWNAFDLHMSTSKIEELREEIRENPDNEKFIYIGGVEEDTTTWLHIDGRPRINNKIKFFKG